MYGPLHLLPRPPKDPIVQKNLLDRRNLLQGSSRPIISSVISPRHNKHIVKPERRTLSSAPDYLFTARVRRKPAPIRLKFMAPFMAQLGRGGRDRGVGG